MKALKRSLTRRIYASLVIVLIMLAITTLLESCADDCTVKTTYSYYEPVYVTAESIRESVSVAEPREIVSVGKIYLYNTLLFVNEPGEGIHIFDNSDPAHPTQKYYLQLPGNYDLAVSDNILYADSYIDLVAFDIAQIDHIHEVSRLEGVFNHYNSLGFLYNENRGIITDWVINEQATVVEGDCNATIQPWGGFYYEDGIAILASTSFDSKAAIAPGNGSGSGHGGSMARFTIDDDHLFALDDYELQVIDIVSPSEPVVGIKTYIGSELETIFPYDNKLFIGTRTGMHIVDITNPAEPIFISTYQHLRSCDPVVVQDDYAYVTLRSGNPGCDGFSNQLDVIDISDPTSPLLVKSSPMTNPHGLGIDDNLLFICDGEDGLKVFDTDNKQTVGDQIKVHYNSIHAVDVIPFNNLLIMIGQNGIYQYDYTNPEEITLLSHIDFAHE